MKITSFILAICLIGFTTVIAQQKQKVFSLASPNGKVALSVVVGKKITWAVNHQADSIIIPSAISLELESGEVLGENPIVISSKIMIINETFKAINYKKDSVKNNYNQLLLNIKGGYGVVFRAYNDGVAYRFFTNRKDSLVIKKEEANFNFNKDYKTLVPYVRDLREHDKWSMAFEALYDDINISQFVKDSLAFLPALIKLENNKKAVLLEADLEDYPGMFITKNESGTGFKGVQAGYPLAEEIGGFMRLNYMVRKRAGYIARVSGKKDFPWRAVVISENDKDLANNDMVQKLASPSRIADVSWIKPGKVAWDWWNDWNISHVDFKSGINTPTYKYYIDFAAANKLEYIIMDEGWATKGDIMSINPAIALQELIDYGKKKNVGIIVWSTWLGLHDKLDAAFGKYSAMGIKGFKIDFMDRDDEKMVSSLYTIATKAAEYHLVLDYHGMYKPTGLQRSFPNILNFEGVKGIENAKWTPNDDMPLYDVTIPFIRMMAGPMDYTPGAMRNATKSAFRPDGSMPMSQGTRCHQLAIYTVFEAPLQMLCDNPIAYMKEQESTDFIAKVPINFDETVALDSRVGEYVALARRKGDTWFVGAMTNWTARDMELDFSFLGEGNYEAEIFKDGVNAERDATDYKKELITVNAGSKIKVHLASGGGWTARIKSISP